ncbi:MAG: ATP-binding protein [Cyclobacteriaceae bacterium]
MPDKINFHWIKQQFFSDEDNKIELKKGDRLLESHQTNKRLFLVTQGKLQGFLDAEGLENYPVIEATTNKFIGVYSYFSHDHKSYSNVVAMEDSVVHYYDKPLMDHTPEEMQTLWPFLISVVVNELYARQHFAKHMAQEKYSDVQRLLKAEKMATLGQMAAGLAHELNNSMGVLNGSLEHLQTFITHCVAYNQNQNLTAFFNVGLEKGQGISSAEARKTRDRFASIKSLNSSQVRKLSKTGIDPDSIIKLISKNPELADQLYAYWEAGCTVHDMRIAAKHSTHVVKSVKQLGVNEHQWSKEVDINHTLDEALVILRNLTKRVKTDIALDENLPLTEACAGQLVQVWINIVKNGIESMIQGKSPHAQLTIRTSHTDEEITVEISDNGPGIPPKILNKIFEPSFTTKVGGLNFGLGLGLSVVQRIITEHDAKIAVSSEPGKTVFAVILPIIN